MAIKLTLKLPIELFICKYLLLFENIKQNLLKAISLRGLFCCTFQVFNHQCDTGHACLPMTNIVVHRKHLTGLFVLVAKP